MTYVDPFKAKRQIFQVFNAKALNDTDRALTCLRTTWGDASARSNQTAWWDRYFDFAERYVLALEQGGKLARFTENTVAKRKAEIVGKFRLGRDKDMKP